jgi:hypothetical protein
MKSCLTFGVFLCFWMSFISISAIPLPTNEDVRSKSKLGQNGHSTILFSWSCSDSGGGENYFETSQEKRNQKESARL